MTPHSPRANLKANSERACPIECVNKKIPRLDLLYRHLSAQPFGDYVDGLIREAGTALLRGLSFIALAARRRT